MVKDAGNKLLTDSNLDLILVFCFQNSHLDSADY